MSGGAGTELKICEEGEVEPVLPPGDRAPGGVQSLRWFRDPVRFMERAAERHGPVFRVSLGGMKRTSFIADAALAWPVLSAPAHVMKMGPTNRIFQPVLGDNSLFLLDGPEHRHHRSLIMPAFHKGAIERFSGLVGEIAARDIETWPRDEPFKIQDRMRGITFEMIVRVVVGVASPRREERLRALIHDLLDAVQDPVAVLPQFRREFGGRTPYARLMAKVREIDTELMAEISERRYDPAAGERADVLSMLVVPKPHEDGFMSDRAIRDELLTLLVAGHETTATALTWTFERLVRHPDAFERLADELGAGVDETYCDAVVRETLRLRPVLPVTARRLCQPVELGGYTFPKGWTLMPCLYLIHRDPTLFEDPSEFRPERFLGEDSPSSRVWLPFGAGPRHCIGSGLSMMAIKVILRAVIQRVELHAPSRASERIVRRNFTLGPSDGGTVISRPRIDIGTIPQLDQPLA